MISAHLNHFIHLHRECVYFSRLPQDRADLVLLRVAHEVWGVGTVFERPTTGGFALFIAVAGTARWGDGDRWWLVGPGDVFAYGRGHAHGCHVEGPHPLELFVVDFGGRRAGNELRTACGFTMGVHTPRNPHLVTGAAEQLYATARSGQAFLHETCVHLFRGLCMLVRGDRATALDVGDPSLASFYAAKNHIDRHFETLTAIADVADACHFSPEHLCRLFRRHGSTTPKGYLMRLKMNLAAHLLVTGDAPLKAIAAQLGFADAYAFAKCFKRHHGLSPGAFRHRAQRGE